MMKKNILLLSLLLFVLSFFSLRKSISPVCSNQGPLPLH